MIKEALLVKAFTTNPDQGNPAGVILDASDMTEAQMALAASTLGYSESAFLLPSNVATKKVLFFTKEGKKVPLCGHGTIATFHALAEEGVIQSQGSSEIISSQETDAGVLKVICHNDGLIVMEQAEPKFFDIEFDKTEIAQLLGISSSDFDDLPIQLVSTGSPKLMIPVKSLAVLEKIDPNLPAMKKFCARSEVRGFYPFTNETKEGSDFHARQFNPFAGIDEDPITGVAAGALGAYAKRHKLTEKNDLVVEQGYLLNKGGKMFVTVNGKTIRVGGYAVTFGRRKLEINLKNKF